MVLMKEKPRPLFRWGGCSLQESLIHHGSFLGISRVWSAKRCLLRSSKTIVCIPSINGYAVSSINGTRLPMQPWIDVSKLSTCGFMLHSVMV